MPGDCLGRACGEFERVGEICGSVEEALAEILVAFLLLIPRTLQDVVHCPGQDLQTRIVARAERRLVVKAVSGGAKPGQWAWALSRASPGSRRARRLSCSSDESGLFLERPARNVGRKGGVADRSED